MSCRHFVVNATLWNYFVRLTPWIQECADWDQAFDYAAKAASKERDDHYVLGISGAYTKDSDWTHPESSEWK